MDREEFSKFQNLPPWKLVGNFGCRVIWFNVFVLIYKKHQCN